MAPIKTARAKKLASMAQKMEILILRRAKLAQMVKKRGQGVDLTPVLIMSTLVIIDRTY